MLELSGIDLRLLFALFMGLFVGLVLLFYMFWIPFVAIYSLFLREIRKSSWHYWLYRRKLSGAVAENLDRCEYAKVLIKAPMRVISLWGQETEEKIKDERQIWSKEKMRRVKKFVILGYLFFMTFIFAITEIDRMKNGVAELEDLMFLVVLLLVGGMFEASDRIENSLWFQNLKQTVKQNICITLSVR